MDETIKYIVDNYRFKLNTPILGFDSFHHLTQEEINILENKILYYFQNVHGTPYVNSRNDKKTLVQILRSYLKDIRKNRWPEIEKYVANDCVFAPSYIQLVIKDYWPLYEEKLRKSATSRRLCQYAKMCDKPLPEDLHNYMLGLSLISNTWAKKYFTWLKTKNA